MTPATAHPSAPASPGGSPPAGAGEVLMARLEWLATSAWGGLAATASADKGTGAMFQPDASGWTPAAHLVAAERALVRASRALHGAVPVSPSLQSGEVPAVGPEPSPLLQLTWLCRQARRLARDVAGTIPATSGGPPGPASSPGAAPTGRRADREPGGRLAEVERHVDEAEAHVAAARADVLHVTP